MIELSCLSLICCFENAGITNGPVRTASPISSAGAVVARAIAGEQLGAELEWRQLGLVRRPDDAVRRLRNRDRRQRERGPDGGDHPTQPHPWWHSWRTTAPIPLHTMISRNSG